MSETTDERIERMNAYWNDSSTGPVFGWFAWHPVWTQDRGWRWLRRLYRWRVHPARITFKPSVWAHSVKDPR